MENTYSLTKSFITKDVDIYSKEEGWRFTIKLKTVEDFFTDNQWNSSYHLWTLEPKKYEKMTKLYTAKNSFQFFYIIVFMLGMYKEYNKVANSFMDTLKSIIPSVSFDHRNKEVVLLDKPRLVMTEEIWDYILYVLKLSCGEKVEAPIHFTDPEAEQFYLAQKAAEDKIRRIKNQANDEDSVLKTMLSITYAFPSLTFDYLFKQTMAQIHWLAKYAAESVSYNINAQLYAAGNMKPGKKLDFFIK